VNFSPISALPERLAVEDSTATLLGRRCQACGAVAPGAPMGCPRCTSSALSPLRFDGRGRIVSHTVVRRPSRDWAGPAPYALAEVLLTEGVVIAARIVDWPEGGEPAIGQSVAVVPTTVATSENGEDVVAFGWRREAGGPRV
jgi:uncharacterized OB-fold protein